MADLIAAWLYLTGQVPQDANPPLNPGTVEVSPQGGGIPIKPNV